MKHLITYAVLLMSFTGLAQTDCTNPYDGNGDGAVTISDLLDLLGLFGDSDSDVDGVWDSVDECVDTGACNYAADPTEPCVYIDALGICGGGCEGDGDGDGICDDVDTCVGDLDECGVCNGPGPTEIVIDEIVVTYDSVFLPLDNEWFVYPVSADTAFNFVCPPAQNEVVLNEINLIVGPNYGQFVELHGAPDTPLDGHSLVFVKVSFLSGAWTAVTQAVVDLEGQTLDSNGFLALYGEGWQNTIAAVVLTSTPAPELEVGTAPALGEILDAVFYGSYFLTSPQWQAIVNAVSPGTFYGLVEAGDGIDPGPVGLSRVPDGGEGLDQEFVIQPLSPGFSNCMESCSDSVSYQDCGDPVSYQGYDYATVLIGEQCWFAENLRSENYDNGDAIPAGLSDSEWTSTTSGATAVYGEEGGTCDTDTPDGDACDEAWSLNEYGRLYNWYAVDDSRGLCPSGWHVPTYEEWLVMVDFLGGWATGGQMKTTYGWAGGSNGTNSSGFSGLPGGYRVSYGFGFAGIRGAWWSSSLNAPSAYSLQLTSSEYQDTPLSPPYNGRSVRCVQD